MWQIGTTAHTVLFFYGLTTRNMYFINDFTQKTPNFYTISKKNEVIGKDVTMYQVKYME